MFHIEIDKDQAARDFINNRPAVIQEYHLFEEVGEGIWEEEVAEILLELFSGDVNIEVDDEGVVENPEDVFNIFRKRLSEDQLAMMFILDEEGELKYPAGLEILYVLERNDDEEVVKIEFVIEHLPLEIFTQESGAGGIAVTMRNEDDGSVRVFKIEYEEGRWKFFLRKEGENRFGYTLSGANSVSENKTFSWHERTQNGGRPIEGEKQIDLTKEDPPEDVPDLLKVLDNIINQLEMEKVSSAIFDVNRARLTQEKSDKFKVQVGSGKRTSRGKRWS